MNRTSKLHTKKLGVKPSDHTDLYGWRFFLGLDLDRVTVGERPSIFLASSSLHMWRTERLQPLCNSNIFMQQTNKMEENNPYRDNRRPLYEDDFITFFFHKVQTWCTVCVYFLLTWTSLPWCVKKICFYIFISFTEKLYCLFLKYA